MTVKAAILEAQAILDNQWKTKFPNGEFRVEQSKRTNEVQILHFRRRPTSNTRSVCCWVSNVRSAYKGWSWMLNTRKYKFVLRDEAIEKAVKLGLPLFKTIKIHTEIE